MKSIGRRKFLLGASGSAMATVQAFDRRSGHYSCHVLATRQASTSAGTMQAADFDVSVAPEDVSVALHHLNSESCAPILAAGASALDVAAGAMAGAPACIEQEPSIAASPTGHSTRKCCLC